MIVFETLAFGADNAHLIGADVQCLKRQFETEVALSLEQLEMHGNLPQAERGTLIFLAHGNERIFAGRTPGEFFDFLLQKGFDARFDRLYLLGCKVGEQAADHSILTNFARELWTLMHTRFDDLRIYAPRGVLESVRAEGSMGGHRVMRTIGFEVITPEGGKVVLKKGLALVTAGAGAMLATK